MLKIVIFLSVFFVSTLLQADSFNWSEYKKNLYETDERFKDKRSAKEYIEKRYDVNVEKKDITSAKDEALNKSLNVGLVFKQSTTYIDSYGDKQDTDYFGMNLNGKIDLSALGYPLNKWYSSISIFTDRVTVSMNYRVLKIGKNRGLYFDALGGMRFVLNSTETDTNSRMMLLLGGALGFNFTDFGFRVTYHQVSSKYYDSADDNLYFILYKRF